VGSEMCIRDSDTIVATINGVDDITFSMMGMLEMPIESIEVTAVNPSQNETANVFRGFLVFGVKKYKSLF
jgi:hypothetical protein